MSLIVPLVIILILVLLNGLFVAAEFAILGVRTTRLTQLAQEGSATARRVLDTVKDRAKVDRYIAAAQLGITLASLGLGMYGEPAIAHFIEEPLHDWLGLEGAAVHTVSFIIALSLITYLHVVVGEMVPKSLALQYAERTALTLIRPMTVMEKVFALPINSLNRLAVWVLRLLNVPPPKEKSRLHTPNELEMIISEGVAGGLIAAQDFSLFRNIFDLSELDVQQMMTPRVKVDAIPITIGESELAEKLGTAPFSRFPVYEGDIDHIVGILHLRDFVTHELEETPFDLRAMIMEPVFLPESASAYELLSTLEKGRAHLAVVLGEYGGTAGVVALEDILEEVVGEVWDEFDVDMKEPITVLAPGHLLAKGTARLDELEAYIDVGRHPQESIAGLVLANVDLPPGRGDTVALGDTTLRIEELEGMTIESVSVLYPPEKHAPPGPPAMPEGTH
jgi:CBS domain containing-hemolysin-like protein